MLLSQMKNRNMEISNLFMPGANLPSGLINDVLASSKAASIFLKSLSHEGRLAILCSLADGEKTVLEITDFLEMKQASVSQQLARLRSEGLVKPRRDGRNMYYSLCDPRTIQLIELLHTMFYPLDQSNGRN